MLYWLPNGPSAVQRQRWSGGRAEVTTANILNSELLCCVLLYCAVYKFYFFGSRQSSRKRFGKFYIKMGWHKVLCDMGWDSLNWVVFLFTLSLLPFSVVCMVGHYNTDAKLEIKLGSIFCPNRSSLRHLRVVIVTFSSHFLVVSNERLIIVASKMQSCRLKIEQHLFPNRSSLRYPQVAIAISPPFLVLSYGRLIIPVVSK